MELVDAGKIPRGRAMTQDDINAVLVERARRGLSVVRLKGGDPFVFGRGGEEMLACLEASIPVTVVPGVTSAVGVPAAAGLPVTHRGITQELRVISAHLPPGDPRSTVDWAELARSGATLVLMMGLEYLGRIAGTLISARPGSAHSSFGHCGRYPAYAAHNYDRTGRSGRSGQGGRPAPASDCRDR